jgi:hypothetical protein
MNYLQEILLQAEGNQSRLQEEVGRLLGNSPGFCNGF